MKNNFSIKNKKIIILGCKNWIKEIISNLMLEEAQVTTIGESNECNYIINFEKENEWNKIKSELMSKSIQFDVLINIGKISEMDGLMEIPVEEWRKTVSQNLRIIYESITTFSDLIKVGGNIVNVFEIGSMEGFGGSRVYEAFKKESSILLKGFTNTLAGKQIRVNALRLGYINTEEAIGANEKLREIYKKNAEKETPLKIVGSLSDVKDALIYLTSDASRFINGEEIYLDGGLHIKT